MRKTILWAIIGVMSATWAPAEEDAPKLDVRNVKLKLEDDVLTGEVSYSLVVGTFFEWNTDPTAVPGLFSEVSKRTKIKARVDFSSVSLDGEDLFANPFLIMTGNRFFSLSEEEITNLRKYVFAGGFIYADDCGGADWSFRHMMKKVFPERKLEEVPESHPIFSSHHKLKAVPKILDLYGGDPKGFGIFVGGRLAVFYTYDTDVPCGWEKKPDGSFVHLLTPAKHEESIKLGVNVILYALRQLYQSSADEPAEEEINEAGE